MAIWPTAGGFARWLLAEEQRPAFPGRTMRTTARRLMPLSSSALGGSIFVTSAIFGAAAIAASIQRAHWPCICSRSGRRSTGQAASRRQARRAAYRRQRPGARRRDKCYRGTKAFIELLFPRTAAIASSAIGQKPLFRHVDVHVCSSSARATCCSRYIPATQRTLASELPLTLPRAPPTGVCLASGPTRCWSHRRARARPPRSRRRCRRRLVHRRNPPALPRRLAARAAAERMAARRASRWAGPSVTRRGWIEALGRDPRDGGHRGHLRRVGSRPTPNWPACRRCCSTKCTSAASTAISGSRWRSTRRRRCGPTCASSRCRRRSTARGSPVAGRRAGDRERGAELSAELRHLGRADRGPDRGCGRRDPAALRDERAACSPSCPASRRSSVPRNGWPCRRRHRLHKLHGSLDRAAQRAAILPTRRAAQNRARDQHRRDQPDARRHPRGGRFRARAPPALRSRGGNDAARHRAREPGLGARTRRARRAARAGRRVSLVGGGGHRRPSAATTRPKYWRRTCPRWCSRAHGGSPIRGRSPGSTRRGRRGRGGARAPAGARRDRRGRPSDAARPRHRASCRCAPRLGACCCAPARGLAQAAAEVAVLLGERGLGGSDADRTGAGPLARRARGARRRTGAGEEMGALTPLPVRGERAGGEGQSQSPSSPSRPSPPLSPANGERRFRPCVALAFPDRVARRRDASGETWASPAGAASGSTRHRRSPARMARRRRDARDRRRRAHPLRRADRPGDGRGLFADRHRDARGPSRSTPRPAASRRSASAGSARSRCRAGPTRNADPAAIAAALLEGVRAHGLALLPWGEAATALRDRAATPRAGWADARR